MISLIIGIITPFIGRIVKIGLYVGMIMWIGILLESLGVPVIGTIMGTIEQFLLDLLDQALADAI